MKPVTIISLILASVSTQAIAIDYNSINKLKITVDFNQNPSIESLASLDQLLIELNSDCTVVKKYLSLNKKEIFIDLTIVQEMEVNSIITHLNDLLGDDSKASFVTLESMKQGTQDWTK
jgi:hypothetical protein